MSFFYPKFFVKSALHGLVPGGFGYYRHLRRYRDPNYQHERDKHPVRKRHNKSSGWKKSDGALRQRDYENYAEYTTHQAQKYREILNIHGGFTNYTVVSWRQKFFRRFRHLAARLPRSATIVCLGARQGTEVEVLRDMGFYNAYGIDLNPGPNNPFVRKGDFMKLPESAASMDALYTNCIDHVFDLDLFLREHIRVLKADGYTLYDLPRYSSTHEPGAFESIGWNNPAVIFSKIQDHYNEAVILHMESRWQWILVRRPRKSLLL